MAAEFWYLELIFLELNIPVVDPCLLYRVTSCPGQDEGVGRVGEVPEAGPHVWPPGQHKDVSVGDRHV